MKEKYFYTAVILLSFLAIGIQPAFADALVLAPYRDKIPSIGTWVGGDVRTFTLTTDVSEGLSIEEGVLTLDGAGHTIDGTNTGTTDGIHVADFHTVTIQNVNVTGFQNGIAFRGVSTSYSNRVENCCIYSNINTGIDIVAPDNNIIKNNTIDNNPVGISLAVETINNEIFNNRISNNDTGVSLMSSQYNKIYNNNFIDNTTQADDNGSNNEFYLDLPTGGNYWSDYTGVDDGSGGRVAGDDIGDTLLLHLGLDNYPWIQEQSAWSGPPLPQPPTPEEAILDLIITVADMNLHQGIENSLDAKLNAALNALDDANQNNDVAAVNSLYAFINAVEAQRGKKLTDAQADTLVTEASNIIAMLSG